MWSLILTDKFKGHPSCLFIHSSANSLQIQMGQENTQHTHTKSHLRAFCLRTRKPNFPGLFWRTPAIVCPLKCVMPFPCFHMLAFGKCCMKFDDPVRKGKMIHNHLFLICRPLMKACLGLETLRLETAGLKTNGPFHLVRKPRSRQQW